MTGRCFECGTPAVHQHHVVPRSMGGTRTLDLCESCHGKIHGHDLTIATLTAAALRAKKARGEWTGEAPYGFRLAADGRTLEPDPDEERLLAEIRALRALGMSVRAIAAALSDRGFISPRTGKLLGKSQVGRMLGVAA